MAKSPSSMRRVQSVVLRYGLSILCVATALSATFLLQPYVFRTPFFFLSIIVSTWFGGTGPGFLAVLLSTLCIDLFLPQVILAPRFHNVPNLAGFVLSALLVGSWSTARRRAEEALRKSEQRFRTFVDHATDAFFLQDDRGVILDVNRQACESLRYTRDELLGMTQTDVDPDVTPADIGDLNRQLNAGQTIAIESRHRRKDGTVFPVEVRGQAFSEGDRRFTVTLVRDITDRKRAEEALRRAHNELELKVAERTAALRQATAELQTILDASPVGIALFGGDQTVQRCNPAFERILGWGADEIAGCPIPVPVAHQEQWSALVQRLNRGGAFAHGETRFLRKDGSEFDAAVACAPLREEAGRAGGFVGTIEDISDRKRGEEALRRSEAYLADAQRLSHTGSFALNAATREPTHSSEEYSRLYGFDPEGGIPSFEAFLQRIHREDRDRVVETFDRAIRQRTDFEADFRTVLPDGAIKYLHGIGHPVFDASGDLVEFVGTAMDVTERKQAEEALGEQANLLNLTHDSVFVRNRNDVITYWNRGAEERYGWTREEAVGKVSHQLTQTIFPAPLEEITAELLRSSRWEGELTHMKRDGTQVVVASRWSLQRDEQGSPIAVLETNNDITERRRTEEALRKSERQFRALFDQAAVGIALVNAAGQALETNRKLQQLLGYSEEEFHYLSVAQVTHPDDLEKDWHLFVELVSGKRDYYQIEKRYSRKDGSLVWGNLTVSLVRDDRGEPLFGIAIVEDITERKEAEAQLTQVTQELLARNHELWRLQGEMGRVEPLAALGRVTGTIAHELGTPLNSVLGYTQLLSQEPLPEGARESLQIIETQTQRMIAIIQQYLSHTRRALPRHQPLDLNALVRETLVLLKPIFHQGRVQVRTALAEALPFPSGDGASLQRVLINVLTNAVDAMESGGTVTVVTRVSPLPETARPAVIVEIKDTGCGIPSELLPRLFDLFVTTKAPGKGTGLGLAVCQEIIKGHGGKIEIGSQVGEGTWVRILLPTAERGLPDSGL